MEFCDLKEQYNRYKNEIDTAIADVIENTAFINGPDVKALESELSVFCGAKHSIGCSNGTDALLIPLVALDVKPDDEILVPAFTFIATAEMPAFWGAKPVFVDIDPVTFNIDPEKIKEKITSKTVGIIPVSLYGQCADYNAINAIAAEHNLWVMEDGAQSFGGEYHGKKSCNLTYVSTTSFFPAKPLGCYGDGGAIFTNDDVLAEKMRKILNHGQEIRYKHKYVGLNGRLDTIQAAILRVKLKYFPQELIQRNAIAMKYTEKLKNVTETPVVLPDHFSAWAQYTIRADNRDKLAEYLKGKGIPTAVHYPIPLYRQECFNYLNENAENFPVSDNLSKRVLSLPMHPFLKDEEINFICEEVKKGLKFKD